MPEEEHADRLTRLLRRDVLDAYRRLVAAARAEVTEVARDPEMLQIFSGFRDPEADAARCAAQGNCDGVRRALCSPHRTGTAVDLYVGQLFDLGVDSTTAGQPAAHDPGRDLSLAGRQRRPLRLRALSVRALALGMGRADRAVIRALTPGEKTLAREAFGAALGLDGVRFLRRPWPFDRAFVPGTAFGRQWIVWSGRNLPSDVSAAPLALQAVLIHELVHVWQAQQGVNLLTGKLRAGDRPSSYRLSGRHGLRLGAGSTSSSRRWWSSTASA